MTKQKSKLKVMHLTHTMDKGENGTFSITSKEAPKLRNAVDPVDAVQQAESSAHVPVKTVKAKTPPATASTASSGSTPPKLKEAVMERPSNTDLECYACRTFNPYMAIHCKNCGQLLRPPVPFLKA